MAYVIRNGDRVHAMASSDKARAIESHSTARVIGGDGHGGGYPTYSGSYEVVPAAFEPQTLDTDGKLMKDDVLVHEIPYLETSNDSGGITVSIAS